MVAAGQAACTVLVHRLVAATPEQLCGVSQHLAAHGGFYAPRGKKDTPLYLAQPLAAVLEPGIGQGLVEAATQLQLPDRQWESGSVASEARKKHRHKKAAASRADTVSIANAVCAVLCDASAGIDKHPLNQRLKRTSPTFIVRSNIRDLELEVHQVTGAHLSPQHPSHADNNRPEPADYNRDLLWFTEVQPHASPEQQAAQVLSTLQAVVAKLKEREGQAGISATAATTPSQAAAAAAPQAAAEVPAPEPTSPPGQAAAAAAAAVLAVHGDAAGGAAEAEAAGGTSSVGRMGGLLHPDQPGLPVTAAVSKPPNSEEVRRLKDAATQTDAIGSPSRTASTVQHRDAATQTVAAATESSSEVEAQDMGPAELPPAAAAAAGTIDPSKQAAGSSSGSGRAALAAGEARIVGKQMVRRTNPCP